VWRRSRRGGWRKRAAIPVAVGLAMEVPQREVYEPLEEQEVTPVSPPT
jgi:hypothetical protein